MIFQRYIDGKLPAHVKVKEIFDNPFTVATESFPTGYTAEYIEESFQRPNDLATIEALLLEEDYGVESSVNLNISSDTIDNIDRVIRKRRTKIQSEPKYFDSSERPDPKDTATNYDVLPTNENIRRQITYFSTGDDGIRRVLKKKIVKRRRKQRNADSTSEYIAVDN